MRPALQYYTVLAAAAVLLALAVLHICRLKDYSMYRFRNVFIAAFCPFTALLIVSLLGVFPERGSFSFAALAREFPAGFANLSIALMVLLGAAMAVSNAALIRHEGMALRNTVGTLLQLGWILATAAAYALSCVLRSGSAGMSGAGRFLSFWLPCWLYCLVDYGECMTLGMMIMGWVASRGKSAYDKDFIIIPGCSISKTGGLLPLLKGRVNRAIRYAWEQERATGRPVLYIPSGGKGADEIMSEGSAMEFYLLSHSAEQNEVFPEKESRNTAENFLFSARIIRAQKPDAKVAFATTNYHVLRCGMLAARAGLIAEGLASSTKWYFWPNGFAREVAAIFSMTKLYHLAASGILLAVSAAIALTV